MGVVYPRLESVNAKIEYALKTLGYGDDEIERIIGNLSSVNDKNGLIMYLMDAILCEHNMACDANAKSWEIGRYEYVIVIEAEATTIIILYNNKNGEYQVYQSIHI